MDHGLGPSEREGGRWTTAWARQRGRWHITQGGVNRCQNEKTGSIRYGHDYSQRLWYDFNGARVPVKRKS